MRLFIGLMKNLELTVGLIKNVKIQVCNGVVGIFVKNNEDVIKEEISI